MEAGPGRPAVTMDTEPAMTEPGHMATATEPVRTEAETGHPAMAMETGTGHHPAVIMDTEAVMAEPDTEQAAATTEQGTNGIR